MPDTPSKFPFDLEQCWHGEVFDRAAHERNKQRERIVMNLVLGRYCERMDRYDVQGALKYLF